MWQRKLIKFLITVLLFTSNVQVLLGQGAAGNSTSFVVPFPANGGFGNEMMVYICTGSRAAVVTVTIYLDLTATTQVYQVAANSTLQLPAMPKAITIPRSADRIYRRSVRIHSDVPVSGYAHYVASLASGGMQLIPVRMWGYDYQVMDVPFDDDGYICVTAAFDNTKVQITPTQSTNTGHAAGIPFVVTLNKGEVYQVNRDDSDAPPGEKELTGSTIKVLPNDIGISYPVGVYTGAAAVTIKSGANVTVGGSADFEVEQMSPVCNWGKHFLTMPFVVSTSVDASDVNYALFRVQVKNPATIVKKNGVQLTNLVNNQYYEYISNKPDYIEADMPAMVTQNMLAHGETVFLVPGAGDGEMIVISPLEDAGKRADFFLPKRVDQELNFLLLCIPTSGLASLTINGSSNFTRTYPHPNRAGYTVVVKRWDAQGAYCTVQSDFAFTGLSYSVSSRDVEESCGSNITGIFYPEGDAMLSSKGSGGIMKNFACVSDSFRLVLKTEYLPAKIEWLLKDYPGLLPNNQNEVRLNPVPDSTVARDGHVYHYFSLTRYYTVTQLNDYAIPVIITSASVLNCTQTQTYVAELYSGLKPVPDFSIASRGCVPFDVRFTAGVVAGDTSVLAAWNWDFGDGQAAANVVNHSYGTQGEKPVYLFVTARNGCSGDTLKKIRLTDAVRPVAAFQLPVVACIPNAPAKFVNQSTYTGTEPGGLTWQWDFGDATKSVVKEPAHAYGVVRSYTVQLIATAPDGCSDTTRETLTAVFNRPKAGLTLSATAICVGDEVVFTDRSTPGPGSSSIIQWNWELGDRESSVEQHPVKKYNRRGDKMINHFVFSAEGCYSDTATGNVQVYEIPAVEAGPDQAILEGTSTRLQGYVDALSSVIVQWSPAVQLSDPAITTPLASPRADQLYYLTAVTGNTCSAYDSVWVKVLPILIVPNAFSPNNDGNHDRWEIAGLNRYPSATVQVFNRFGQKVFESKGSNVLWDGTWQNKPLTTGTYYYMIHPGSGRPVQSGPVTILR
jgi:gliding motility-associated-like protein